MSFQPGPEGIDRSGTDPAQVATARLDSESCHTPEAFGVERVERPAVASGNETVGITAPLPKVISPGVESVHHRVCALARRPPLITARAPASSLLAVQARPLAARPSASIRRNRVVRAYAR